MALRADMVPMVEMFVKYKTTIKTPGIDGVLKMSLDEFEFVPIDPTSSSRFRSPFKSIQSHRCSNEGPNNPALLNLIKNKGCGGYIFEFESFNSRDICREFVCKHVGIPKKSCQVSAIGKAGHSQELSLTRKRKQQVGLTSSLISHRINPVTDGLTNKVSFKLTPEIIHQIFAEKPAVCQAFLTNVPHKISEKDFWAKFCRAEYLLCTKNVQVAAAEAADDEELAIFFKQDDILTNEALNKIRKVDATIDLYADQADHGRTRDGNTEYYDHTDLYKRNILQEINRHGAVVL